MAIMMPNWIGDACMATPALRSLRAAFSHAEITLICRPIVRELLRGLDAEPFNWFDDCLLHDKKKRSDAVTRKELVGECRRRKFDVSILLTNSWWTAVAMWRAGISQRVGYDRDGRGWFLTDRIPVAKTGRELTPIPAIDYYGELIRSVGGKFDDRRTELAVEAADTAAADHLWSELQFDDSTPTLVINSNAATVPERVWPQDRVAELARRVAEQLGWQVLLHCGPSERQSAREIERAVDHVRVRSMADHASLPVGLSKAVMARAERVVTTDSGARHIAIACNRPVITLFGPTSPAWTRTYNVPEFCIEPPDDSKARHEGSDAADASNPGVAGSLTTDRSLNSGRSMQDISVDSVWETLYKTVDGSPIETCGSVTG